jgi:hypothetical protein
MQALLMHVTLRIGYTLIEVLGKTVYRNWCCYDKILSHRHLIYKMVDTAKIWV